MSDLSPPDKNCSRCAELERELARCSEAHRALAAMVPGGVGMESGLLQSSTAATPKESPLAWLVFVSDHPEGWDYVVFPDEHDAESYAAEREDREVTPLYRMSAFVVSATASAEAELWRYWTKRVLDLPDHNFPLASTFAQLRDAMREQFDISREGKS